MRRSVGDGTLYLTGKSGLPAPYVQQIGPGPSPELSYLHGWHVGELVDGTPLWGFEVPAVGAYRLFHCLAGEWVHTDLVVSS